MQHIQMDGRFRTTRRDSKSKTHTTGQATLTLYSKKQNQNNSKTDLRVQVNRDARLCGGSCCHHQHYSPFRLGPLMKTSTTM